MRLPGRARGTVTNFPNGRVRRVRVARCQQVAHPGVRYGVEMTIVQRLPENLAWYALSAEKAARQMGVGPDQGLDTGEAERRVSPRVFRVVALPAPGRAGEVPDVPAAVRTALPGRRRPAATSLCPGGRSLVATRSRICPCGAFPNRSRATVRGCGTNGPHTFWLSGE
jgi:hypothetical protein